MLLQGSERDILVHEAGAFASTLSEPGARARYQALAQAAEAGSVPSALIPALEALLELLLQTQRIRRQHGPDGQAALSTLFGRTPRGAGLRRAAHQVNQALSALRGQTLEQLRLTAEPGGHTLHLTTDHCRLTLKLDPAGARIESLEL